MPAVRGTLSTGTGTLSRFWSGTLVRQCAIKGRQRASATGQRASATGQRASHWHVDDWHGVVEPFNHTYKNLFYKFYIYKNRRTGSVWAVVKV